MNRLQIRNLARKRLGETTAAFWTDTELNTWIDDACDDIAVRAKCLKDSSKMTITASVAEYAISSYYPTAAAILEVYFYTNGTTWLKLAPTNREELNFSNPGWKSASAGTPTQYYWDKEDDLLGFYVKPDSSNAGSDYAEIYFAKKHTDISSDSVVIDIPECLHPAIIDNVVAIGLDSRGWGDKSNDAWQKYFSKIHDYQVERNKEREDDDLIMRNYRNI